MQQIAVNIATSSHERGIFGENGNIFSVNGPPGTGKTTLLKEVIANNFVEKAVVLSQYNSPDDAFEEVKQLVKEHPEMETVSEQLYEYNAEKAMRDRCQARADYLLHERRTQKEMADLKKKLEEAETQLECKEKEIERLKSLLLVSNQS